MFYKRTFLLNNIVIKEPFFESKHKIDMQIRRFGPPPHVMGQVCPMTCGGFWNSKTQNWHANPEIWTPPACHGTGLSHDMRGGFEISKSETDMQIRRFGPPRMSWDRSVPWHAGGFEIPKSKTDMPIRRFGPPPHVMGQVCPMTCGGVWNFKVRNWHANPEIWNPPACHGTDLSHDMGGGSKSPDLHVSFVFWNFKTPPARHGTDLSHDMRGGAKSPDLHVSFENWFYKCVLI